MGGRWLAPLLVTLSPCHLVTLSSYAGLECPAPTAQVGEVRAGTPLAHVFRLVNVGPHPVEITDVHPGCGCLVPRLGRRQVGPGEEADLRVEVNTLTQAAGPHAWSVRVSYQEDGRPGEMDLVLGGRVVSEIAVEPPALLLFTDASLAHELAVRDSRPRPLSVTAVESSSPHLRARPGPVRTDSAGRRVQIVPVEIAADCPPGRHDEVLRLVTDDSAYPTLEVPVSIVKRPPGLVRASPDEVALTAPAGQALPAHIVLLSAGEQEVAVERVQADDPAIECRWAPGPGPRATLRIRVDRKHLSGDTFRGSVRVHLSRPTPQVLVVPVTCTLR
jgi:hypothetical protein